MDRPVSHNISVHRGTQDTPFPLAPYVRDSHPLRLNFPVHSTSRSLPFRSPTTPDTVMSGLGCSAFARHYSPNLLFSSGYLDVSLPQVPFPIARDDGVLSPTGFPIRTSTTLALVHSSSRLFAVYHVLLRHLKPRHSPCALIRFFTSL